MTIKKLSEREHIILRPAMYIGATDKTDCSEYVSTEDDRIELRTISYVPGLIKIINEIIDNSVDVAIKTNFEGCNVVSVTMTTDSVTVQDNGTGIPVLQNTDGQWLPELAWGHARAGSNFDDDENRTQIGMNGVGSFATNCFSKKFVGISDDGSKRYEITFLNNAETFSDTVKRSKERGVMVQFWPDLERFGLTEIDGMHMSVVKQRLLNLSLSFPKITFKFNGKKVNVPNFKRYVQMIGPDAEIFETEDYKFAILHNPDDDFRQLSYVNGLKIPDGGTHVDIIAGAVVSRIREKLLKKYKSIKPGDIRNKLMVVAFLTGVKNTKFNSQAKEKITNSITEMNAYFGDIPFDTITAKVLKNKTIIESITEVYRIKEEFRRRQELKSLEKPEKKVKSEKYYPATALQKYLVLVEGESALGTAEPVLGRKNFGYYVLKGVPLNAWSAPMDKFTGNKELSELYRIIQSTDYEKVLIMTDQDLDGMHIRGLLFGFIAKYLPNLKGRVGVLQTPVIGITKGNKLVRWYYDIDADVPLGSGEKSNYYKGLGSWDSDDLKEVMRVDGLSDMIKMMDFDSEAILEEWLGKSAEPRKKYILANDFSIAKV